MASEKKCPHCGKWTRWNQQATDRCMECSGALNERALILQQEHKKKKDEFHENNFYRARDDDNFLMVAVRKAAMIVHAIFAFIAWIFMWLIMNTVG